MRDEITDWLETLTVEQITGDTLDLVRLAWAESARRERERCAEICENTTQTYYSDGTKRALNYECADEIRLMARI